MDRVTLTESRQVRLVADLQRSQAYYRDVLGCEVDGWGHALRGRLQLILQQAQDPADVRPNAAPARRDTYPTDWQGPDHGWDSFVFVDYGDFDALVAELRAHGADIVLGPVQDTHSNGMTFKNVSVRDPDGYTLVFGCGGVEPAEPPTA